MRETFFALILTVSVCYSQPQSHAGSYIAIGIGLVSSGIVGFLASETLSPTVDKWDALVSDMKEDGRPQREINEEQLYLDELTSKQTSLRTASFVMLGAGLTSFIMAALEDKRVKVQPLAIRDGGGFAAQIRL